MANWIKTTIVNGHFQTETKITSDQLASIFSDVILGQQLSKELGIDSNKVLELVEYDEIYGATEYKLTTTLKEDNKVIVHYYKKIQKKRKEA